MKGPSRRSLKRASPQDRLCCAGMRRHTGVVNFLHGERAEAMGETVHVSLTCGVCFEPKGMHLG